MPRRQDLDEVGEAAHDKPSLPSEFERWSPLARAQYLEATIFLPEYLLSSQGDRMAMAHSVEGRFPFLDHRVVEFCNRLAVRLKLCGLNEKYVLKRALNDLLPENVSNRPKRPYRTHPCQLFSRRPTVGLGGRAAIAPEPSVCRSLLPEVGRHADQ